MEEVEYNEDEKLLLDLLGPEIFSEVLRLIGGRKIYLSQRHEKQLRNQHMRQRFTVILETGHNVDMQTVYEKLGRYYNLSPSHVERIVNRK